jgi:hypothetical protein
LPIYTDAAPLSTVAALGQVIEATHINQYYNYFGVVPAPPMSKSPLKAVSREMAVVGHAPGTST